MVWMLPTTGETRVINRFAIFPTIVENEVWWLESITLFQSYNTRHRGWNNDLVVRKRDGTGKG